MINPATLKGFRDLLPEAATARNGLIRLLEGTFEAFGFVPIDTPALEYAEVLLGKGGGETDKQVYRFYDQGNRDVAMRYDLTVPFARFMAAHRPDLYLPFKRYHIAKVWRGENTQRGRYREFVQCDFDIVGCDTVSADFEILHLMVESLKSLDVKAFHIEFSHRGILNRFLRRIGLAEQAVEILRIIDKSAKVGESGIRGLLDPLAGADKAEQILDFIQAEGSFFDTLEKLTRLAGGPAEDTQRITELQALIEELELGRYFRLNPSITRGLDYYTGLVYETYLDEAPGIGSVCSGGRYNDLASLYTKETIPGVGSSIGLDRLLAALEEGRRASRAQPKPAVLILFMDERYLGRYHRMASTFREAGLRAEVFAEKKKLSKQFQMAEKKGISFALICGESEMAQGTVTLKDLAKRENHTDLSVTEAIEKVRRLSRSR